MPVQNLVKAMWQIAILAVAPLRSVVRMNKSSGTVARIDNLGRQAVNSQASGATLARQCRRISPGEIETGQNFICGETPAG
jgi:hypothetical protein